MYGLYCDLTVEHILVESADIVEVGQRYHEAGSLQQLFQEISVADTFVFLQEMGLFYRK